MKYFTWNIEKNEKLKEVRGISFEEVVFHIERGYLLDIIEHPSQEVYWGQKVFIVKRGDYIYLVPFTESKEELSLKTIIPSKRMTKNIWIREEMVRKVKIDKEEEIFLKSVENDEWVSVRNKKSEIDRYTKIAKNTFKKDRRVNIRMSSKDLEAIQTKALEEGIPYQTLISSRLHKFITGRLMEKKI